LYFDSSSRARRDDSGSEGVTRTRSGYLVECLERLCAKVMTPGRYEERVKRVTQARFGEDLLEAMRIGRKSKTLVIKTKIEFGITKKNDVEDADYY